MMDDDLALRQAKQLAGLIAQSLPAKIEIAALTLESKVPFKALSLRELLIHRVSALATPAVELFEQKRLVPAMVLTRAVIETVALTFALDKELKAFLQNRDIGAFDDFLMKSLMGSRVPDWELQSLNVLTLIQHAEKQIPGFEQSYNSLSEYSHPNWAGMLGIFGQIDREAFELILGQKEVSPGVSSGVRALSGALLTFCHFYEDMVDMLHELNSYFENAKGAP
jgi:hypothetical protein